MCALAPGLRTYRSRVQDERRPISTDSRSVGRITPHPIAMATVAFLISFAQSALAQDLTVQIVGTWKWTGHVYRNVGTGNTANVYGEKPTGLMVFTKNGNLVYAVFGDTRLAAASTPATDGERAALFNTMAAATGVYTVDGNTLAITYSGSWNQSWTGTTQKRQIEIVGNKLTLMSAPFKSAQSGQDTVFVVTYERVE